MINEGWQQMQWYIRVIKQYAVFSGRASRIEYWMFVLINFLFGLGGILLSLLGLNFVLILYSLAIWIPTLAVQVRRLHDISRSAWWLLVLLIPLAGTIVLFIFDVLPGDPDTNLYGSVPPSDVSQLI